MIIDAQNQQRFMEQIEKTVNISVLDQNANISKKRFGKHGNQGYFQTLRLQYDPVLESQNRIDRNPYRYENLRFTGIGGDTGVQPIWPESLLGRLKSRNGEQRIKLAIGITMYNENWELFMKTMRGVC